MYPYGDSEPNRRKPAPSRRNGNGRDQYGQAEATQAESSRAQSRRVPQPRFPFHDDAEEHLRMPAKPVRDAERVQSDELIQPTESHPTYGAEIQAGSPLVQVQSKSYRDYKSLTEAREMENFELMDPAYRLQHEDQIQKARRTEDFDLMDPAHRLQHEDRPQKTRRTEDFDLMDPTYRSHHLRREAEQSRQQRKQAGSQVHAVPYVPQGRPQVPPRVSSSQRPSRNDHHHRRPDLQYRDQEPSQGHAASYAPTRDRYSPRPSRDGQHHQQPEPHYHQDYPHQGPETRSRQSSRHTSRRQALGAEELLALDSTSHWIRNPSARNGRYPPQPILQEQQPAIRYSPPRREVRAAPVVPFEVNPTPQQIDEMERQRRFAKMQSEERRVRVDKKWQRQEHKDFPPKKSRWDLQQEAKELKDQQELGGKYGDWWIDQHKQRRHPMQSSSLHPPKKPLQIRPPSPEFRYLPSEPRQRKPLSPEFQLATPKTKLKRRGFAASLQEKVHAAATKLKKTISGSTEPLPHPAPEPQAGPDTPSSDSSGSGRPFSFSTSVGSANFHRYETR